MAFLFDRSIFIEVQKQKDQVLKSGPIFKTFLWEKQTVKQKTFASVVKLLTSSLIVIQLLDQRDNIKAI